MQTSSPVQFLSQPFVVGDRVEILTSGGGHVITGTVERVDPMRTILRSDAELPITMPNKACCPQDLWRGFLVVNVTVPSRA